MSLGIISFSDSKYFDNFKLLRRSLKRLHDVPICLYYDELKEDQINWCIENATVLKK